VEAQSEGLGVFAPVGKGQRPLARTSGNGAKGQTGLDRVDFKRWAVPVEEQVVVARDGSDSGEVEDRDRAVVIDPVVVGAAEEQGFQADRTELVLLCDRRQDVLSNLLGLARMEDMGDGVMAQDRLEVPGKGPDQVLARETVEIGEGRVAEEGDGVSSADDSAGG